MFENMAPVDEVSIILKLDDGLQCAVYLKNLTVRFRCSEIDLTNAQGVVGPDGTPLKIRDALRGCEDVITAVTVVYGDAKGSDSAEKSAWALEALIAKFPGTTQLTVKFPHGTSGTYEVATFGRDGRSLSVSFRV